MIFIIYPDSKVYSDGSHYIAIPPSSNPSKKRPKPPEELVTVVEDKKQDNADVTESKNDKVTADFVELCDDTVSIDTESEEKQKPKTERQATRSELFNEFWSDAQELAKNRRHKFLMDKMRPYFNNDSSLKSYVDQKTEAKIKSLIARKTRFIRKAYMNDFNYFVTFTYSDELHTEESFRRKILATISNYQKRKGWKYMGVWERGGKTDRLHFHGLFWIPDGTMPGELFEKSGYDFNSHSRKLTVQNTYFNERFGRCDMEEIEQGRRQYDHALAYILKYIAKTGEKIVYSHNTPMYMKCDVDDNDVICPCGMEDSKLLLFDNFVCRYAGEIYGEMSAETKKRLPTSN